MYSREEKQLRVSDIWTLALYLLIVVKVRIFFKLLWRPFDRQLGTIIKSFHDREKEIRNEASIAQSKDSKKYYQVEYDTRTQLVELAVDHKEYRLKDDETKCLEALRTSDYLTDKERVPERVPGTCNWFLRHERYKRWQTHESSAIL